MVSRLSKSNRQKKWVDDNSIGENTKHEIKEACAKFEEKKEELN
jgi:hypothetical protein